MIKRGIINFYVEDNFIVKKKYTSLINRKKTIENLINKYKKLYPRQYLFVVIVPDLDT
jgi:hypothetical protein